MVLHGSRKRTRVPFGESFEERGIPSGVPGESEKIAKAKVQCGDGTNGEKARIVVTRTRLLAREKLRRACAVEESSATVARWVYPSPAEIKTRRTPGSAVGCNRPTKLWEE